MKLETTKLGPLAYAGVMTLITPFVAVLLLVTVLIILISWPLIPFIAYFERRNDPVVDDINNRK